MHPGGLRHHIQEISTSSSDVSEHDLTELVAPPAGLRHPGPPPGASARHSAFSAPLAHQHANSPAPHAYPQQLQRPQHSFPQQLPYRSLPSPSPPLSSPHVSASSRGSNSNSSKSTYLESFPSWDPTWRSGGVSEDGRAYTTHVPRAYYEQQQQRQTPRMPYAPQGGEHEDFNEHDGQTIAGDSPAARFSGWEAEYSEGDQRRLVDGEYRLGVGYSHAQRADFDPGAADEPGRGKGISAARKAERLRALEKEYGSSRSREDGDGHAAAQAKSRGKKSKGGGTGTIPDDVAKEKIGAVSSFKERRAREKQERKQIDADLGVDKAGRLLSSFPRMAIGLRWVEGLLSLLIVAAGIGATLLITPSDDENPPSPPPKGEIPTLALYVLSALSLVLFTWSHIISRCFRRNRNEHASDLGVPHQVGGGMVLPMFAASGQQYSQLHSPRESGSGWFGPKKAKKGKHFPSGHPHAQPPMTVNLVMDPAALARMMGGAQAGPARYDDSGYSEASDSKREKAATETSGRAAGSKGPGRSGRTRDAEDAHESSDTALDEAEDGDEDADFAIPDSSKVAEQRVDPIQQLLMQDPSAARRLQERWRAARKSCRHTLVQDIIVAMLWLGISVWTIGFGQRCRPGSGGGWCDTYNLALAGSVLLAVAFVSSATIDSLDLRRSRSIPRISRGY